MITGMPELHLSPSKVEQFRCYRDEQYNVTKQSVIDTVMGTQVYKPKAEWGTAFHALLDIKSNLQNIRVVDGGVIVKTRDMVEPIFMSDAVAKVAREYREAHPGITYEIPHTKTYDDVVRGFIIVMKMRMDGIEGTVVRDGKTTEKPPHFEDWFQKSQWRFYLDAVGAREFYYDFFVKKMRKEEVIGIELLSFFLASYEGMHNDCVNLIREFLDFCEMNDLMEHLKPKIYAKRD